MERDFEAKLGSDEHHFFLVKRSALITQALQGCLGNIVFLSTWEESEIILVE